MHQVRTLHHLIDFLQGLFGNQDIVFSIERGFASEFDFAEKIVVGATFAGKIVHSLLIVPSINLLIDIMVQLPLVAS